MYCKKCGKQLEPGEFFCRHCGSKNFGSRRKLNLKLSLAYVFLGLAIISLTIAALILINQNKAVHLSDENYYSDGTEEEDQNVDSYYNKDEVKTVVEHESKLNEIAYDKSSALALIEKYAKTQDDNCYNKDSKHALEISKIEKQIETKYGIYAVNLCELDVNFAKELEKVLEKLYDEFPMLKGKITNLTIGNFTISGSAIAYFMPFLGFSPDSGAMPLTSKRMIALNSLYYLNLSKFKNDLKNSEQTGHFPKNTSLYSPLAHEFGHYIADLITMAELGIKETIIVNYENASLMMTYLEATKTRDYDRKMITEAYENYRTKYKSTLTEKEFRRSISYYASTSPAETIAEAFHDYYLNNNQAKPASLEIMSVIKKYLKKWYS